MVVTVNIYAWENDYNNKMAIVIVVVECFDWVVQICLAFPLLEFCNTSLPYIVIVNMFCYDDHEV